MSNHTFLYTTPTSEKPLFGKCPERGRLLMAAMSIPVFWYMIFDEESLTMGPGGDASETPYMHMTTQTSEGLALAESRWPAVSTLLEQKATSLFRTWVSFVREKADKYIHCEAAEWYWMFDSHDEYVKELRTCLQAFRKIPKRKGGKVAMNAAWGTLLGQAHVSGEVGDLRPLGNLSYCGFAYHYSVPWSEEDDHPLGAMSEKVRKAKATSDKPEDIRAYLERFSGLDEFRLAKCSCGSQSFRLRYVDGAQRICTSCKSVHFICESEEYWEDSKAVDWKCKGCKGKAANIGVGFIIEGKWVSWLTIGVRCEKCSRLDNCVAWELAEGEEVFEKV